MEEEEQESQKKREELGYLKRRREEHGIFEEGNLGKKRKGESVNLGNTGEERG